MRQREFWATGLPTPVIRRRTDHAKPVYLALSEAKEKLSGIIVDQSPVEITESLINLVAQNSSFKKQVQLQQWLKDFQKYIKNCSTETAPIIQIAENQEKEFDFRQNQADPQTRRPYTYSLIAPDNLADVLVSEPQTVIGSLIFCIASIRANVRKNLNQSQKDQIKPQNRVDDFNSVAKRITNRGRSFQEFLFKIN